MGKNLQSLGRDKFGIHGHPSLEAMHATSHWNQQTQPRRGHGMMQPRIRARLRHPGSRHVHARSHVHHHAMVLSIPAAARRHSRLRLRPQQGLQGQRTQQQQ